MKKRARKQNELLPIILIAAGVLLVVGALVWQAISSGELTGQNIPEPNIQRVTLANAKAAFDSKSAVFVDVRDAGSFAQGHIPGAVNIPVSEMETRFKELDPNQWIITYCTWPAEESSARAAQVLVDNGFKRVDPILGGFEAWERAGFPVQK